MSPPNMSACEHAKHVGMPSMQAFEHGSMEAYQAHEHASIQARQVHDLADSCLAERFIVLESFCMSRF